MRVNKVMVQQHSFGNKKFKKEFQFILMNIQKCVFFFFFIMFAKQFVCNFLQRPPPPPPQSTHKTNHHRNKTAGARVRHSQWSINKNISIFRRVRRAYILLSCHQRLVASRWCLCCRRCLCLLCHICASYVKKKLVWHDITCVANEHRNNEIFFLYEYW